MSGMKRVLNETWQAVKNPIRAVRIIAQRLNQRRITQLQTCLSSLEEHHRQYEEYSLNEVKGVFQRYEDANLFNHPANKFADLIDRHPHVRSVAVDIGCGAGWLSARLSREFERVIAIEPSAAGLNIARQLYPQAQYPNIEWIEGFAEQVLPKLVLKEPALFVTATVLTHLTDDSVAQICDAIKRIAPVGSILSFAECWGPESHEFMWHTRTPEWWQEHLPSWDLDFHGPPIENVPGRHKGFHGVKRW